MSDTETPATDAPTTALVVQEIHQAEIATVPEFAPTMIPHSLGGLPYLEDYIRLANVICKTEMVPDSLRGRPDAVCAVMMSGYEIGVGPMQALQGINLIKGKPSVSPELMRALIAKAGHEFIVEATDTEAVVNCRRREWAPDRWAPFSWTMADAQRAGLLKASRSGEPTQWDRFPRAMLSARVTSEAARTHFADVIAGLSYTPDEVEEFAPMPTGLSRPGEMAMTGEAPPALQGATRGTSQPAGSPEWQQLGYLDLDHITSLSDSLRSLLDEIPTGNRGPVRQWCIDHGYTRTDAQGALQAVPIPVKYDDIAEYRTLLINVKNGKMPPAPEGQQTPATSPSGPAAAETAGTPPGGEAEPQEAPGTQGKIRVSDSRKIHALMHELGIAEEQKHEMFSSIIGRTVESEKDLTIPEAAVIKGFLNKQLDEKGATQAN